MSDTHLTLTPDQAESLLPAGERVHSFVNPPWGFVGCDSSRKAVVRLIREAKLIEIGDEHAKRMKHALVVHAREGGCKLFATDMERVEAMERRLTGTTAV
jgi:hypothetical protein